MQTKQAILEQFKQLERDLHAECEKAWNSQRRHTLVKQGEMRRELSSACAQSGHYYRGVHEKCEFCGALRDNDTTARNLGVLTGAAVNGLPVREQCVTEAKLPHPWAVGRNKIPEPLSGVYSGFDIVSLSGTTNFADLGATSDAARMAVDQGALAIAGEKGVVMINPVTGASTLLTVA